MNKLKVLVPAVVLLLIIGSSFSAVGAKPAKIYKETLTIPDVVIRPGPNPVTSDMTVIVWSNQPFNRPDKVFLTGGKTAVGIPGWTNTADIYGETAKLELSKPGGVKYFIGINMPTNANGDLFGNVNLTDDAYATLQVLNVLREDYGAEIVKVISHSQGCTVHCGVQKILLQEQTSLEEWFGVAENDLVACSPLKKDARWYYIENMNISAFAETYVKYSPERGYYVQLDDYTWVGMTFMNKSGVLQYPPPMDKIKEFNVVASLASTFQLVGLRFGDPSAGEPMFVYDPQNIKVDLPPNLFQGTNTKVYFMKEDTLVDLNNSYPNAEFLTGSSENAIIIDGDYAVHSLVVTRPDLVFEEEKDKDKGDKDKKDK